MTLELPLDVIEVPNLPMHTGHGQREGSYNSLPALRRLLWRKIKRNPLRLIQFILKNRRLERAARRRQRGACQIVSKRPDYQPDLPRPKLPSDELQGVEMSLHGREHH